MKLQTRSLLIFLPLFILNILVAAFFVERSASANLQELTLETARRLAGEVEVLQNELETQALSTALLVARQPDIVDAYGEEDIQRSHELLAAAADPIADALAGTIGYTDLRLHFHRAPGFSQYRTWTDKWSDDLRDFRHSVTQVIETGEPIRGIELGRGGMVIRGVAPIVSNGAVAGSVENYFQPIEVLSRLKMDQSRLGMVLLADKEALSKILFAQDLEEYYNQGEIAGQMISYISADWLDPQLLIDPEQIHLTRTTGETIHRIKESFNISSIPIRDYRNDVVGIYVFVQNISDLIDANNRNRVQLSLILASVNIVILISLLFWIFTYVIKPVRRLDQAVEMISRGSGDLRHRIPVERKDELGEIAVNFNRFMSNLGEIISKARSATENNETSTKQLTEITEQTVLASEKIGSAIGENSRQLTSTSEEMRNSKQNSAEIRKRLETFQESVEQLSAIVEESSAGLTEMLASLGSVNKVVQDRQKMTEDLVALSVEGERAITDTAAQIGSIRSAADQIEEFTSMINEIADRTNLLSMNAAIEAAHAGEAGKGFAVVAEEIRSLAETSSTEASRIKNSIKQIIQIIVAAEESGKSSRTAFTRIAESVHQVAAGLTGIAASTEELSLGSREVMNAILEVKEVTVNVKESSQEIDRQQESLDQVVGRGYAAMIRMEEIEQEMSSQSSEISRAISSLKEVVELLNTYSAELNEEIKSFTL